MTSIRRPVLVALALVLAALSCKKDAPTEAKHDAVQLLITVQPATSVAVGTALSMTVVAADADGAPVTTTAPTITVSLAAGSPSGAILNGTLTRSAVSGSAVFSDLTVDKAGTGYALTVVDAGGALLPATSTTFTVTAAAGQTPTKLVFLTQPTAVASLATITSLQVAVADASGNTITSSTASVTIAIVGASGTAGAVLGGTLTKNAVNGVATFSDLTVDKVGTGYLLSPTSSGLTATSSSAFNVTPGAAAKLVYTAQPPNVVAGAFFSSWPQVAIQDASGNVVTSASNSITLSITSGTGTAGAALSGVATVPAAGGVAVFSGTSIAKAGTGYTFTAAATGLTSATSSSFDVAVGAAAKLAFLVQPIAVSPSGTSITPAVQVVVQDANSNTIPSATNTITLAITSGTGAAGAVLGGTVAKAAIGGNATFSNLTVDKAGTGYTLTATSSGLTSATSTAFAVTAPAATKLTLTTNAAGAPSAAAFTTQPIVAVQDAGGVTLTSDNSTVVTMTVSGSGIVVGTATATASAGVATFATVGISGKADTTYTLTFAKSGLTSATQTIVVTPGAATQLAFTVQPSASAVGVALATSPKVTVQDSRGNTVTSATTSITVALVANATGAVLGGTKTVSAASGLATFSTLTLDIVGTGYTLGASASSLTSATSSAFDVVNNTPAWIQLTATGTPGARYFHTSVYDAANDRMILFGGYIDAVPANTNDTWVLTNASGANGTPAWTQLTTSGGPPALRQAHTAVYDATNNRMIIFGGSNYPTMYNDVWVLSNANGLGGTATWTQLTPSGSAPAVRGYATAVYDAANNRMTIFGGNLSIGNCSIEANDTWVLSNANGSGGTPAWTQMSPTGGPPDTRNLHGAIYDPTSNRMTVLWGRLECVNSVNSLWTLDHANNSGGTPTWSQLSATGPTARSTFTTIYDAANQRATIFGGSFAYGGTQVNEVWVLSDAVGLAGTPAWTQLLPTGTLPATRSGATAVYNATLNRMIVFGGNSTDAGNVLWILTHANGLP